MEKIKRPILGIFLIAVVLIMGAMGVFADIDNIPADTRPVIIIDAGHPEFCQHYTFSDLPPNMQFT